MRADAPVHFIDSLKAYFVVRHDLVSEALRRPEVFSSQFPKSVLPLSEDDQRALAEALADGLPRPKTMITADGGVHTRYRRLVSKAFSPRAIAVLEPTVRTITTKLIDSWIDRERIELVEDFAVPLPVEVIANALNVPEDRLADFRRWSDATVLTFGATPTVDERVAAIRTVQELQRFFVAALEERRRAPQDDLLTGLLEARIDDDDEEVDDKRPLDVPEMVSLVQELLVGGNETTTKLIAEMVRLLAADPGRWEHLRAHPEAIPDRGRGVTAARLAGPGHVAAGHPGHRARRCRHPRRQPGRAVLRLRQPGRGPLRPARRVRPGSRRTSPSTWPSGAARTSASGPAWPGSRPGWPSRSWPGACSRSRLPDTNDFPYNPSFLLRGLVRLDVDIVAA